MENTETEKETLRKRFNPEGSELRKAQLRMLEMLKFIDNVCRQNNLRYWLDSGTLLGAARHQGFIPWDDDTDICMPKEDLIRFKKIMISRKPSKEFVLQCHETDPNFYESHMVLRDLKSEYLQDSHVHRIRKFRGLQVDIFPLETTVSLPLFKVCRSLKYHLITSPLMKNKHPFIGMFSRFFYYIIEKGIIPLCRFFTLYKKNVYYNMSYGCLFSSTRYLNTIFPLTEIEFEGAKFSCPGNTEGYLTNLYGNWKKIPPLDKIHTHDVQILFYATNTTE